MYRTKNNKVIIEGDRDKVTNLLLIPLEEKKNNNEPDAQAKPRLAYIQIQHTSNSAYR